MKEQATQSDEQDGDDAIHPDIPSYVTTDAEFQALVQEGLESARRGPNRELAVVDAEIRKHLLGL